MQELIRFTLRRTNLEKLVKVKFGKPVKRKKRIRIQFTMLDKITSKSKKIYTNATDYYRKYAAPSLIQRKQKKILEFVC